MNDWLAGTPLHTIPGAVVAGLVAGTLLPLLGLWVVVQRVVFLGVALSQVAAAGVALGLVLGVPPLALGLAATLLVAAAIVRGAGAGSGRQSVAGDGTLGALYCAASALALLFVQRSPADLDEVWHVLHGNLIYASGSEVQLTAGVLVGGVFVVGLFRRQILFASFDADTATALGMRSGLWQLLLFSVLAVVLAVCMRTTGSLLTFALLVLPPLAALGLGLGLGGTLIASGALGFIGTLAGLLLAVGADLHVESSITVVQALWLPLVVVWRRSRWAGLVLAALALAGGVMLSRPADDFASDHAHHHDDAPIVAEDPFHVDVQLAAHRDGEQLQIDWTLSLWRRDESVSPPPTLWLVLTAGDEFYQEQELSAELADMPVGKSEHHGMLSVPAPAALHRVEGQLWTGSPMESDAEPLDAAVGDVAGADVAR